ncbi:MAG: PaaI family thioesterase [Hyphomicrobiaceae bacterium]
MTSFTVDDAAKTLADNFAHWVLALGIKPDAVSAQGATLRIPANPQLCRVGGILCGQALASGADTAMVIALASAMGSLRPLTTVDMTINFMRPIAAVDALLEAKVMRLGKTLAFCTCEIRATDSDKPAAFATGTYALIA